MNDKTTLLYVDDEPINLMLFEVNFKQNYNILTASSGIEALEKLHAHPDIMVVVSDMKMPGMNGIEFIKLANKSFPHILYYIYTGYDITKEIAEALSEKLIIQYFCKPFNMKEIEESIENSIK